MAIPMPSSWMQDAVRKPKRSPFLGFLDTRLEQRFQLEAGAEGRSGYLVACAFGVTLWLLAAIILPLSATVDVVATSVICGSLALVNVVGLAAIRWASTMDRQHGVATPIAIMNGIGALSLTTTDGVAGMYAVSALLLVEVFWLVARTRFVFALVRAAGLLTAFAVFVNLQPRIETTLDVFILLTATVGILLALYRLEASRRDQFVLDLRIAAHARQLDSHVAQSDRLLGNVLPLEVVASLRDDPDRPIAEVREATVLFADLVDFTRMAADLPPASVVRHLNEIFSRFDDLAGHHRVEKIKTIGDAYMAARTAPVPSATDAEAVVALGLAMIDATREYSATSGLPFSLRVGIHSGPLVAGVIGKYKFSYDMWGDTVNVASRMESQGVAGSVQVSEATWDLVHGAVRARPRGEIELKGRGWMRAWLAEPATPAVGDRATVPWAAAREPVMAQAPTA